ncbi:unnamed protein product, partial [marine sediment metagenome]
MMWMDVDAALAEVPVNLMPLTSDTDFKTIDEGIAFGESGMTLFWHFTTTAGATSVKAVTPTTGGDYDWAHKDHGMYTIEIPASGGGDINNDSEGFGYFTGVCDSVLPWRGPTIGFRDANLNALLVDNAFSATRGLSGTALPAAAADDVGGLPISDAGELDLDTQLANTNEVTAARMGALTDWLEGERLDLILDIIAADTTTDIPGLLSTVDTKQDTAQTDLDTITGTGGVFIGTDAMDRSGTLDVNTKTITAAAITAAAIATDAVDADALAADALAEIKAEVNAA